MKKSTLLFGVIGGVIIGAWGIIASIYCDESLRSMLLGYTAMLIAFSVIFVAIKKERDNNNGVITFGRAFGTALMITFVTSTIYVIIWLIDYYAFMPDFMDKFAAKSIQQAQASHLSPQQLKEKIDGINQMKAMYRSPFWVILFTYAEILPIGLVVSLIASLVLKRGSNKGQLVTAN
jgi:Na+/H+-dicarboxylate symporter